MNASSPERTAKDSGVTNCAPPSDPLDGQSTPADADGDLVTEGPWGIYYKPDPYFGGVQGGYVPYIVDKPANEVAVDPYGLQDEQYYYFPRYKLL